MSGQASQQAASPWRGQVAAPYLRGTLYAKGYEGHWYRWMGTTWTDLGTGRPQ